MIIISSVTFHARHVEGMLKLNSNLNGGTSLCHNLTLFHSWKIFSKLACPLIYDTSSRNNLHVLGNVLVMEALISGYWLLCCLCKLKNRKEFDRTTQNCVTATQKCVTIMVDILHNILSIQIVGFERVLCNDLVYIYVYLFLYK